MYYRKDEDRLSNEEFFMPFGGKLCRDDRRVHLAGIMPWPPSSWKNLRL